MCARRQALQVAARACAAYFEQTKKAWMETVGMVAPAGAKKAVAAGPGPGAGAGAKSARKPVSLVA